MNRMISGVLLVSVASIASAQVQPQASIVECALSDGSIERYRVSETSWEEWDQANWAWRPRACQSAAVSATHTCTVQVTPDEFRWQAIGYGSGGSGSRFYEYNANLYIIINRNNGALTFHSRVTRDSDDTRVLDNRDLGGTCRRIDDPALQPRPERLF